MEIETSARLHLSLIDLNGFEGRIDGGIGLSLKQPSLQMECFKNDTENTVIFNDSSIDLKNQKEFESKIYSANKLIQKYLKINNTYTFKINQAYPVHQGLGLGTQLMLSTAKLVSQLNEIDLDTHSLAKIVHRGSTSGIGVEAFNSGGFIVDGGHKMIDKHNFLPSSRSEADPAPILARYDFPEDWKIILAIAEVDDTISGQDEVDIFKKHTPVCLYDVRDICYLTLMKVMPSIIEEDLDSFSDSVNKIQKLGFKKAELSLQPPIINKILDSFTKNQIKANGISSFGPTCFGITDTNTKQIKKELMDIMDNKGQVIITRAKNYGANLRCDNDE